MYFYTPFYISLLIKGVINLGFFDGDTIITLSNGNFYRVNGNYKKIFNWIEEQYKVSDFILLEDSYIRITEIVEIKRYLRD